MAQHGVHLVKSFDAMGDFLCRHAEFLGEVLLLFDRLREELVQWWIEQADGCRQTFEFFKDAGEVFALIRQEFAEGLFAIVEVVGENHFAHGVDAVSFEEHVFGASEADADSAEGDGLAGLLWRVGVCANVETGGFAAPLHELLEALELLRGLSALVAMDHAGDDFRRSGFEFAAVDGAAGAINGEVVPFFEGLAGDRDGLLVIVDRQCAGTADANLAHLTGDEGRVRGHTALGSEDAFSSDHAAKIFGAGFVADEEHFFTAAFGGSSAIGVEVDLAGSGTRTRRQTGGKSNRLLHISDVEDRGEELVKLVGRVAQDGGFPVDELLFDHVHGELQSGSGGALAIPGLKHEQFALLDGELHVLNVFEVFFQGGANFEQFGVRAGHLFLELQHGLRGAHAGDDVLTLSVDEELTVEFIHAVSRVAGEGDAGSGVIAGVAVDHRLDVDGGAPLGGDVVFAAVNDRAIVHPGTEHSARSATELVPDVAWEGLAGAVFDQSFETLDQFHLVGGGQVAIDDVLVVNFVFEGFDDDFEGLVVFAFAFLDTEDDVAVHLNEAAVAVPGEAFVVGGFGE